MVKKKEFQCDSYHTPLEGELRHALDGVKAVKRGEPWSPVPDYGAALGVLDGPKERYLPCQFQGKFKSERPLGDYMAGASPEDSEPLFVLEPLPELPSVIDSFFGANPLLLIAGFGSIIYLLTKYEDPFTKLWTSTLVVSRD